MDSCFSPLMDSCFSPLMDSCFSPLMDSCFSPLMDSCFSPLMDSCFSPLMDSCFSPLMDSCFSPLMDSFLDSVVAASPPAKAAPGKELGAGQGHVGAELLAAVKAVESMVKASGPLPAADVVKRIDRKLKYCRNPALMLHDRKERKERSKSKRASHSVALTAAPPVTSSPL
ncbi:unnamed protein product [Closterium sp. NIES-65]|nr:unnamed protein product [Closterium sp. NIES-65]